MNAAPAFSSLRDLDQYQIVITSGLTPRYDDLKSRLRYPDIDDPRCDDGRSLRELLFNFRAVHLILRSVNADTLELEADFRGLRPLLRRELPHVDAVWTELGAYTGADDHREALRLAREMLLSLSGQQETMPTEPRERDHARFADSTMTAIPLRAQAYPVLFENRFVKDMVRHWHEPSLVSTSHAVEALLLLHKHKHRAPEDKHKHRAPEVRFRLDRRMCDYVEAHYADGAFKPALGASPNLYGTRSAIVVYKSNSGVYCDGVLDKRTLDEVIPPERRQRIKDFTLDRLDLMLEKGHDGEGPTTIIDLFHALYVFKNMVGMESSSEELPPLCPADISGRGSRILGYLDRCFRRGTGPREPDGFALSPDGENRCLTACMFAHRIAHDCGIEDDGFKARLDRCRTFAREAISDEGGFGSSSRAASDMVHTYIGITLDEQRKWRLADEVPDLRQGVERFLAQCSKGGGYALATEFKPSAYGTRLAIQVYDRLELPLPSPFEVGKFLDSLGDQHTGYRGFNLERPEPSTGG